MPTTPRTQHKAVDTLSGSIVLTDGATIATDCSQGLNFTVTLGGNRTLAAPTNIRRGVPYRWFVKQDGTGSRGLTLDAAFALASGLTYTPSTAAGAVDVIHGIGDPSGAARILVTSASKGY
jgi:hypothetical protein